MMQLLAHPGESRGPVRAFEARAGRAGGGWLRIAYRLDADLSRLLLPAAAAPVPADGLWRHTCFEAFIAAGPTGAYRELNFSPSGAWAAYGFTGYRAGMATLQLDAAPELRWQPTAGQLALDVAFDIDALWPGPASGPLRLGLAAVLEEQSGTISHWALRHPQDKPDFHHPDGFVLEVR